MVETSVTVNAAYLSKMTNAEHVEFMTKVKDLIVLFDPTTLNLKPLFDLFIVLLEKADAALVAARGNSQTMSLLEADKIRDDLHRALCFAVKTYQFDTDAENVETATKLQRIINTYGAGIRSRPYNEETALIRSLVDDLTNEDNAPLLAKIGADTWTTKLQAANESFKTLMTTRLEEDASGLGFTVRDVRKEIDPVYRQITSAVETFISIGMVGPFEDFITQLNAAIEYYK